MNSMLAMLAEVYRLYPQSPRIFWPAYSALRGFAGASKHGFLSLMRFGGIARKQFGRSKTSQAYDMARAWWESGLPPGEYYEALLARHGGGSEILNYLFLHFLQPVVTELQFDLFGTPSVQVNDKASFGEWLRSKGLPGPKELALDSDAPRLEAAELEGLGDHVIVKPRASGQGHGIEAWDRQSNGEWSSIPQSLTTPDLIDHLHRRAAKELRGMVIQQRLFNHPEIIELCGKTLSTCRIVTIRNERDKPEIVEFFWRMATRPDALVDNYHAGGVCWMVKDFETGTIDHGVYPDMAARQEVWTHHPRTGKPMVGYRHPLWAETRNLALTAHRLLPDLLLAGWDIATTSAGPMLIEVNVPVGSAPSGFLASNGFESSRYGKILAWHARRWIERHVPQNSRRRVASGLSSI